MAGPFEGLPPGTYFNPTAEECVRDFLRPWIAGVRPATDRIITDVYIYSDSPAALVRGRAPGFSRGFEHKWLLLTHCIRISGGKGRGKARVKRDVATGGNWKVEQRSKGVAEKSSAEDDDEDPPGGDRRRTNGFYLPGPPPPPGGKQGKKDGGVKTPWLMEELTTEEDEAAAVTGWRGERAVCVFCKLYVSPRATDDERREIFGEDGVPADIYGHAKTLVAALPQDLFDAVAENFYAADAEGQGPPPPPRVLGCQPAAARRLLGHQQGQSATPPPPLRVLGHQQGQPAAPPPLRVPGHHRGHAAPPRGVPAQVHGHGGPRQIQGSLGFQRGQAAPRQIQAGPPPAQYHYVVDPYHQFQESSPGVAGFYNSQGAILYHYAAPSFAHLDPQQQQGEEMVHTEKKPRLEYGSPPAQPQGGGSDSDVSSCVDQASTSQEQGGDTDADADAKAVFQEEGEAVLTPSPSQGIIPGTATGPPAEHADDAKVFADLVDLQGRQFVDDVPDFLRHDTFKPPFDDETQPTLPLGFDEFSLEELTKDMPDF
ncbi:unnamed protein product [Urochloa decumbens]|uniref:NAC domain-containing protein n=1 Tax=Urochloa decumbens TaxID=240449 RepID=A0ABC8WKM6_9POAL